MTDTSTPEKIYLKDYTPPAFFIDSVALRVELGEFATRVQSSLYIRRNPKVPACVDLRLNGLALPLNAIRLDETPVY